MRNALYRAARALAIRGCPVFPCRPGQKEPATPHGVKDATADLGTIHQWWAANPGYNVAIATGAISGFWVLDIDGLDGEASLRRLEAEHDVLPSTIEVITGGGGRHLYFRLADEPVRCTTGRIGQGIDTRSEGGYVLVPPSLHPCGRRYAWSVDSASTFRDAPEWLIKDVTGSAGKGKPLEDWHRILTQPIPNGRRNATLASIVGKLLFHDLNLILIRDLLLSINVAQCDPPLPVEEVESVIVSVAQTHLRKYADG
jgi:Bifunctional DNA primase/polymerase, N-terminal/Primase C terminal 1 (PriCT-1)